MFVQVPDQDCIPTLFCNARRFTQKHCSVDGTVLSVPVALLHFGICIPKNVQSLLLRMSCQNKPFYRMSSRGGEGDMLPEER